MRWEIAGKCVIVKPDLRLYKTDPDGLFSQVMCDTKKHLMTQGQTHYYTVSLSIHLRTDTFLYKQLIVN